MPESTRPEFVHAVGDQAMDCGSVGEEALRAIGAGKKRTLQGVVRETSAGQSKGPRGGRRLRKWGPDKTRGSARVEFRGCGVADREVEQIVVPDNVHEIWVSTIIHGIEMSPLMDMGTSHSNIRSLHAYS